MWTVVTDALHQLPLSKRHLAQRSCLSVGDEIYVVILYRRVPHSNASVAQLGERQTEDLKVPCSIHGGSNSFFAHTRWCSTASVGQAHL